MREEHSTQKRRQIAYICSRYPSPREVFIMREILALERAGVKVCVYSLKQPAPDLHHRDLEEIRAESYYSRHLLSWRVMSDNIAVFLRFPFKYLLFPITQAWAFRAYPLQVLKSLSLFPKMIHYASHMKRQGIKGANSCWANFPTTLAMVGRSFFGIPYCMTGRAWDIYVSLNQIGLDEKIANANIVRTNNDAGARFMRRFCRNGVDEKKIIRVYNPFDVNRMIPREEPPTGSFLITSGGSLTEKKGLTYLLDAIAMLKKDGLSCDLQIVGDGVLRRSLEEQISRLRLNDCVELIGAVPNQHFLELVRRSSAFILPCIPAEDGSMDGIPNVLIESMSLGVPVISTSISGIPELIEHGVNGLLVPPRNSKALAAGIRQLMENHQLQRNYGKEGRHRVEALFEMNRNAQLLIEMYQAGGVL